MLNRLRARRLWIAIAVVAGMTSGCDRAKTSQGTTQAPSSKKPATRPSELVSTAGPADALNRLVSNLAAGRGDEVVAAVPERFRDDLDRFLAETVQPIDPTIRKRLADAVGQFATALGEKQDFVLTSERIGIAGPAAEVVRGRFDVFCRLIAATASWPGWAQTEAIDANSLIRAVSGVAAADPAFVAALRDVRFEPVSEAGESAVVRLAGPGSDGKKLAVVRVDGCWIPAVVAKRWGAMFADNPSETHGDGANLTEIALRIDEVTAALRAVSTQAEFDALAERAATSLLSTAAAADRERRPVAAEEFVTVEILGGLTDEQKDRILWDLASRTDAPASGLADAVDRPDGITVTVGPVADVERFAKRLDRLNVERVDRNGKTITARFAGP